MKNKIKFSDFQNDEISFTHLSDVKGGLHAPSGGEYGCESDVCVSMVNTSFCESNPETCKNYVCTSGIGPITGGGSSGGDGGSGAS